VPLARDRPARHLRPEADSAALGPPSSPEAVPGRPAERAPRLRTRRLKRGRSLHSQSLPRVVTAAKLPCPFSEFLEPLDQGLTILQPPLRARISARFRYFQKDLRVLAPPMALANGRRARSLRMGNDSIRPGRVMSTRRRRVFLLLQAAVRPQGHQPRQKRPDPRGIGEEPRRTEPRPRKRTCFGRYPPSKRTTSFVPLPASRSAQPQAGDAPRHVDQKKSLCRPRARQPRRVRFL